MDKLQQAQKEALLQEIEQFHQQHELSKTIGPDYFEPGMMAYPEQWEGIFDCETDTAMLRFEVMGTRYGDCTEQIESVRVGDPLQILRDRDNAYNANNFIVLTEKGKYLGNLPARLCDTTAPLYDSGSLHFIEAKVSFTDPISKRSRHAKQAILFVELRLAFRL